jgi:hypothetical protein
VAVSATVDLEQLAGLRALRRGWVRCNRVAATMVDGMVTQDGFSR